MAKKVLVVDDEPAIVKMVTAQLVAHDYEVHSATNGKDALKICRNIIPDAIIMDIMMPDTDGASVAEELKENPEMKKVPIIFLTAAVKQSEVPRNHKIGGEYYLAKPFKAEQLLGMLKKLI